MNSCQKAVLNAGVLERGATAYASGSEGNNKLNFDRLFESPLHLETVLRYMGKAALSYAPDLFIGIPSGGEKLAEKLTDSKHLNLPIAYLKKVDNLPGVKTFGYKTTDDEKLVLASKRIVLIEDVFRLFTSTRGALAVPGVLERTEVVIAVWDRGRIDHPARGILPVPSQAIVNEHIPDYITPEVYDRIIKCEEAK